MSIFDRVRPSLDQLLSEDVSAARRGRDEGTSDTAPAPTARETFAERIARSHEVSAREVVRRESKVAALDGDHEVLERYRPHRVIIVSKPPGE